MIPISSGVHCCVWYYVNKYLYSLSLRNNYRIRPSTRIDDRCTSFFRVFFMMEQIHNLHKSFICRNHLNTEINSLVIKNANLTSLNLTTSLFSRIGLNNSRHISRLKKLQIVNTTLEHINICSPKGEEDGGGQNNGGHHQDLIDCQSLSGLNSLDLRDNNLTRLEEFKLVGLVELYLSGM